MDAMKEIGLYLIQTLGSLYLTIVVLRFLFQVVKADFYNPISQFIVKATNPLLLPLRRIIPGLMGIDLASLVLALILQFIVINISALLYGGFVNPIHALTWGLVGIFSLMVEMYFWGLIAMIIISWVAPQSYHPAVLLLRQLVEPVMTPFRKLLPPMGGLDLSPLLAFMALNVVRIVVSHLANSTGLPAGLVLGI